ncbi:hypothetical protein TNCV_2068721 [Trichonephila clavipes]|uniref:Uncharacterized protein n=1 Tax=Trichonephila clavipes TaxID=2585209 RepID=A0A8X6W3R9_TRICX|nr:hypothetical protein TNCV_2068721 [Trichonephila clavipes]
MSVLQGSFDCHDRNKEWEGKVEHIKKHRHLTQPVVPLTLRRAKSIISAYIDKYTDVTQKPKSLGKPRETLATVGQLRSTRREPRLLPAFA